MIVSILKMCTFECLFLTVLFVAVATGQSNVKLSVTRDGLFGNSDVYWQTGGNDSSVSDGSISPKQGILRFVHGESSKTFFVKVLSRLLHDCEALAHRQITMLVI